MSKKHEVPTLPPQAKRHMGIKAVNTLSNTVIYALLVCVTIIWLVPFVCIWRIIREVLEVQPDFSRAAGIVRNGWMAVHGAITCLKHRMIKFLML